MADELDSCQVDTFSLTSSNDVIDVMKEVALLNRRNIIIHIASFIHNTVLVQTLKRSLIKEYPDTNISLIKSSDKSKTILSIFSIDDMQEESLHDTVLHKLYLNYQSKEKNATEYRNQLFSRYFTDHLTGLPNVYQLRKDLQMNEEFGLVLLKIDNFATINNFYGFLIGDYVIEQVGKYLKETVDDQEVYKLSGSEFAFTLSNKKSFYDLKDYLSALSEKINAFSILYQNSKIFIDFTMASNSEAGNENIFSKVSMALNYAQEKAVPFWIYEDRMNFENDYKRNFQLSEVVREAVKASKIVPYFQAIVDNKTDKIVKYECLARLIDSNDNVLSPLLFIPVAKKIKVYTEITKQMVDKSFAAFENSNLEFNINLSIEDVLNNDIYDFIIEKLKHSPSASRVTFEILESEAIGDFNKVEEFITEVKRYGAKIAIDDFGSGYSNFSYLIEIKAHYIKIDGSLIKNIHVDNSALLVVETIVSFAKKLGMKTVAEFVHSSVIMDKVKELGIDYSQGFYIDEPSIRTST